VINFSVFTSSQTRERQISWFFVPRRAASDKFPGFCLPAQPRTTNQKYFGVRKSGNGEKPISEVQSNSGNDELPGKTGGAGWATVNFRVLPPKQPGQLRFPAIILLVNSANSAFLANNPPLAGSTTGPVLPRHKTGGPPQTPAGRDRFLSRAGRLRRNDVGRKVGWRSTTSSIASARSAPDFRERLSGPGLGPGRIGSGNGFGESKMSFGRAKRGQGSDICRLSA
jgi:hypothetical protein